MRKVSFPLPNPLPFTKTFIFVPIRRRGRGRIQKGLERVGVLGKGRTFPEKVLFPPPPVRFPQQLPGADDDFGGPEQASFEAIAFLEELGDMPGRNGGVGLLG